MMTIFFSLLAAVLLRPTFNSCSIYVDEIPAEELKVEIRTGNGKWQNVPEFHGSIMNLTENTEYELRIKGSGVSEVASFRTWSSEVKVGRTITIDPEAFQAPYKVEEKGTADAWVKIVIAGGKLNNPDPVPTFIFDGAEYVILENATLTGARESMNVIQVKNSKFVRLQNLDISGWGREGTPDYTRLEGKRNYGPGNGHNVDKWGDVVDYDGAIYITKGAFGTLVERCWIHDPVSRSNGWFYHHPKGPQAIIATKGENTVLRWNDFIGSDDHRWNDAVEGPGNFAKDGGLNRDCDVTGNFMIFSADDCIELDGGQRNIRCFGNRFESAHCGVSTQGCMVGPSFVYDNLFSGMGDQYGMSAMTIKTDERSAKGAKIFIAGNILWGKLGGGITMRKNSIIETKGNTFCEHQEIIMPDVSPLSKSIDDKFDVKLEEKDLDPSFPRRPLDFVLSRARVSVGTSREDVVVDIKGRIPAGTKVVKNGAFPWIEASLEGNSLRIKFNDKLMKNRREYRAAVLVRTPEGLSRPLSIYADTEFVPPYTPERKGDNVYYAKGFHLLPGEADTARIFVEKSGWYTLMVHGKNNLEFSRRSTLPLLNVSVDGEQSAVSRPAIYPYSNWSPAAKRDTESSGKRCWQYHLQPGEHTVTISAGTKNAPGHSLSYEIDGLCFTDNPESFEPNVDLPGLKPSPKKLSTPDEVSAAMSELLLSTDAMAYEPVGCFGRPKPYGIGTHVQYSVVSLWVNAIENARLRGDVDQLHRLLNKYEPFAAGLRESLPPTHVDYTIYGALPLAVYRMTGDERALKIGLKYADAEWDKPLGNEEPDHGMFAGSQRMELWEKGLSPQSRYWVDDLYMITLVQVEAYKATGDRKYIDRAAKTMAEYLPKVQLENGLVYHAPDAPFIWGRGAGWVAGGMTLLLDNLPEDSQYLPIIKGAYLKMMKGLLKYQRSDGMWGQLVDDKQAWPETSGTAMFAYGFASGVRRGLLDRDTYLPAARKAWKALCTYLDAYGNLGQVCTGTNRKNSREWYLGRPKVNGDPHGQAPMMWLANELIKIDRPSGYALEWNIDYRTDVPYEVLVDPVKLGYKPGSVSLGVYADGKALQTVSIDDGTQDNNLRLRFSVPAGTKELRLDEGQCVTYPSSKFDNAFRKKSWSADKTISITETDKGVLLKSTEFKRAKAICRCSVPAGVAGKPCRIELDVENTGEFSFPNSIFFNQYDKNGNLIPEEVSDKRWTSHTRPAGKKTQYRELGYVHPDAAVIVLEIELRATEVEYDYYGLPLLDTKRALPQMLVSHIAIRPVAELPFPGYNNSFFAEGISGKPGDSSLKLDRDRVFWYCTRSHASWAGGREIRDPKAIFYPTEAGTVEAWFKPNWKKTGYYEPVTFFCANQHLSIVNGHQQSASKGDMLLVQYTPPKPTSKKAPVLEFSLMDVACKKYQGSAEVWIEPDQWVHIAAQWTPGGQAALFVDGKKVISFEIKDFKTVDLKNAEHPNDENSTIFLMGANAANGRILKEDERFSRDKDIRFYEGEADALRISSVARYSGDFTPSCQEPQMDDETRALFNFNRSFDGRCSGGLGWISGSMRSYDDIVNHTILGKDGLIQYWPVAVPDYNNPYKVLHIDSYNRISDKKTFAASTRTQSASFEVGPGRGFDIKVDGEPWMDFVEIANPGKTVLKYPIVLAEGDIDARSYGDMKESLGLSDTMTDRAKVDRIFDWLLKGSDYFTFQAQIFDPGTDKPQDMENRPIPLINTYCGYECGPLNNLAVYLFANVAGCPANHTSGYGHSFEEVFYDGKNHIYDLSARKFFPTMNGVEAACLSDADVQDAIISRHGGSSDHFVRMGYRPHSPRVSQFPEKFALKLNPGEKLQYWWTNDGNSMNLQSARRGIAKGKRKVVSYEYSEETNANVKDKIFRMDRFIPEYGNGLILFDGKPSEDNPAFCEFSAGSFCYKVHSCYPIVAAQYQALDAKGKPVKMDISTDFGHEFRTFSSPATYQVRGRYEYLIRVNAPLKKISRFIARTELQINSRIIGGKLKEGINHLTYKAEGADKAKVTIQWRTADKPITFPEAVQWGTIRGCEQSLVVLDPAKKLSVKVEGASAGAKVRAVGGLNATLSNGILNITTGDKTSRFGWVTVNDGGAEKTLTVMVCAGIILQKFNLTLSKTGQEQKAKFDSKIPEGEYALYSLVRFPSRVTFMRNKALGIKFSGKDFIPLASAVNDTQNYFKVQAGTPGQRGPWRWDFAFDPRTRYPSHYMRTFKIPATDKLSFNFTGAPDEGPVEVGAILLVPESDDIDFKGEIIKNLFSLNPRPWAMLDN